jgi:hypothetical protein
MQNRNSGANKEAMCKKLKIFLIYWHSYYSDNLYSSYNGDEGKVVPVLN